MLKNYFIINNVNESEMASIIDYYNNGTVKTLSIILDDIQILRIIRKYGYKDIILLDVNQLEKLKDNDIALIEFQNGYYLISKNIINDKFLMNL